MQAKVQYGAFAASAVKTSEVVCQFFLLFLSLAQDAFALSARLAAA
jgi:hypothetical protein